MNLEEDRAFEEQLRQVKPSELGDLVVERIGIAIRESEKRSTRHSWGAFVGWIGMVAAASIMIVVGLSLFNGALEPPPESADGTSDAVAVQAQQSEPRRGSFEPVLAQNNLKERVDEGIVFLGNGLTARRYRYEFIDRVVWKNPASGAVVEMEVPRDEVVLIPVQTY